MASCVGYAHAHVTRVWVMGGVNSLMHTRACGGRRDVRSGHWGARNIVTGYVSRRSCAAASACTGLRLSTSRRSHFEKFDLSFFYLRYNLYIPVPAGRVPGLPMDTSYGLRLI